jgi:pimeloyl-ACP methyl ester carboxylesterase
MMERLALDDLELTYQVRGAGEPVVLIHATAFVSWYQPLVEALEGCSTLTYRRHLRRSGSDSYRPLTVAEDAEACARLMNHVGWSEAHVAGHSYGALVGLQLATDHPDQVGSLALLEPAARGISSSAAVVESLGPIIAAYRSGEKQAALDGFLHHVCGEGYETPLAEAVPGAFGEALAEADLFFQAEMPAVQQWSFGPADAARVRAPVLNVLGAQSEPRFVEGSALVQSWFPEAERLVVPGAGHLLMVQQPSAVAQGLVEFFSKHRLTPTPARSVSPVRSN